MREKKLRLQRSAPEPGEENQDLAWMQGLSNRLDAYSFTADEEPLAGAFASEAESETEPESDDSEFDV